MLPDSGEESKGGLLRPPHRAVPSPSLPSSTQIQDKIGEDEVVLFSLARAAPRHLSSVSRCLEKGWERVQAPQLRI